MKIVILLGALLVIGIILLGCFGYWFFPNIYTQQFNWGKQVCMEIKPAKAWTSKMYCQNIK